MDREGRGRSLGSAERNTKINVFVFKTVYTIRDCVGISLAYFLISEMSARENFRNNATLA